MLVFVVGQLLIPTVTSFSSLNIDLMMWTTLVVTFLIGIAFATQFGSVLGLGAIFPPSYTTAIMSGMGLSGTRTIECELRSRMAYPLVHLDRGVLQAQLRYAVTLFLMDRDVVVGVIQA